MSGRSPYRHERRYPLRPLQDLTGYTLRDLADQAHVSGSTLASYGKRGVPMTIADRLAVRCGFHPVNIWPSWFEDAIADDTPVELAAAS